MASTLLLDVSTWDLCADVDSNIAVATEPYSLAQDAASAIRTFYGEVWYNTTLGIRYFTTILGKAPPVSLMKADFVAQAETVPDVASAVCYITSITDRTVKGQVQVFDEVGTVVSAASF